MLYKFSSLEEFAKKRELIRSDIREICQGKIELLYVALNEAVNNAFIHGYKGAPYAPVEVVICREAGEIVIAVRHEGQGLQTIRRRPRMKQGYLLADHGRGLQIIKQCTDSCQYSGDGREIVMRKKLLPEN